MSPPISWRGIRGGADNIGILCVMMGSGFFLKGDVAAARSLLPLPVAAARPLEKNFLLPRFLSLSNHFLNAWQSFDALALLSALGEKQDRTI